MGKATTSKRLNTKQLVPHLGTDGTLTVRGDPLSDAEKEVEVEGLSDAELEQKLGTYVYDETHGLSAGEKQLRQIRTKARAVRDGTDTFTNAQMQQIVARLALRQLGEDD